jgi:hypothetical protein
MLYSQAILLNFPTGFFEAVPQGQNGSFRMHMEGTAHINAVSQACLRYAGGKKWTMTIY